MTQYGFYFDSSRCTGCKTCELACKDYKNLDESMAFRVVYDYEGGGFVAAGAGVVSDVFAYHVSAACNHCTMPACLVACTVGAITKDGDTGLVFIDPEVCVGSKQCVEACPYHVPKFAADLGIAKKCDGCLERVGAGKKPICVEACPLRALDFDDVEALRSRYGDNASIAPLAAPEQTQPNLVVKMAAAAKPSGDTVGAVANLSETL